MFIPGVRASVGYFGGAAAVAEKFPGADEIAPASARVVGEPEAVGAEDDVVGEEFMICDNVEGFRGFSNHG